MWAFSCNYVDDILRNECGIAAVDEDMKQKNLVMALNDSFGSDERSLSSGYDADNTEK